MSNNFSRNLLWGRQQLSFLPSFLKQLRYHMWKILLFLLLFIFFLLPIIRLVYLSFTSEAGLTFTHYTSILQEQATWTTVKNTLYIVFGSTSVSVGLGVMTAWLIAYTDIRAKKMMQLFIFLPFVIPSYITTLAWSQFLSPSGIFAQILGSFHRDLQPWNLYSMSGIIFIMGLSHFPLVYLLTAAMLKKIPREFELSAQSAGAGKWTVFRKITFPLALPGIAGGGLLAFIASLDNFGIPAFLGIPAEIRVLSTYIYEQIIGFGPSAFARGAVLSVLLAGIALLGTILQWLLTRRIKHLDTIQADNKPRFYLGNLRLIIEIIVWIFLLTISFIPLVSMFMTSLVKAYGVPYTLENLSFKNYYFVLFESPKAKQSIVNSVYLSVITTAVCAVFGTAAAYIRTRKPSLSSKTMELLIGVPYALPGTVLALAMIFSWMEPIPNWNPGIYGSISILFIAYMTRFLILQMRGSIAAFSQIDLSIEEAARTSGTNGFIKWRKILLPLLLPGVLSGAFLVFLTALTELTVSALLWSSKSQTIGLVIFNFEQAGYSTYSTAFSSVIVLLILLGFGLLALIHKVWQRKVIQ